MQYFSMQVYIHSCCINFKKRNFNETSFNETSFISALKTTQNFSQMKTKHKKTLICNRKKNKNNL